MKACADCYILKYVTASADFASFYPNHTHRVVTIVKRKEEKKCKEGVGVSRVLRFPTTFPTLFVKMAGGLN